MNVANYGFTLRFRLAPRFRFGTARLPLALAGRDPYKLELRPVNDERDLSETTDFEVVGSCFGSYEDAAHVGRRVARLLPYCSLAFGIGLDLRGRIGSLHDTRRDRNRESEGGSDPTALTVYSGGNPSVIWAMSSQLTFTCEAKRLFRELTDLMLVSPGFALTPRLENATELYHLSHFAQSHSARVLALFNAVEVISGRVARSPEERDVLAQLVARVDESSLNSESKASLRGALRSLKFASVAQQCAQTVQRKLGSQRADEFLEYGEVRNRLAHGGGEPDEIRTILVGFDKLVSDLIVACVAPLLGEPRAGTPG
jgi:hypothetical protein